MVSKPTDGRLRAWAKQWAEAVRKDGAVWQMNIFEHRGIRSVPNLLGRGSQAREIERRRNNHPNLAQRAIHGKGERFLSAPRSTCGFVGLCSSSLFCSSKSRSPLRRVS